MTSGASSRTRDGMPWLVVIGILVAALSLRGPIVSPTPVMREIEADFGIGAATAGLLTSVPVLMFAALTPLAALYIRRAGAEFALLASLVGVLVGTFVRALPGFGWMLVGMLVIGASITIGNVVVPVIIRRDVPPARVGVVTASYSAFLNAGSLTTSLLTAPVASVIGWQAALLVWSGITIAGIVVWSVHLRRERLAGLSDERFSGVTAARTGAGGRVDPVTELTGPLPTAVPVGRDRSVLRRPVAWLLVAAFAIQCLIYYALTTWLPTLTADELGLGATSAGALASLYQGVGIAGAFLVPLLTRFTPAPVPALTICVSWVVLTVGLLVAPELLWLWLPIGAIGHAGGFVVIFTAMVVVSRDDGEAARMSAFVQGGGYAIGALGGPLLGGLHELTGGWTLGLVVMVVLAVVYCIVLLAAVAASRR